MKILSVIKYFLASILIVCIVVFPILIYLVKFNNSSVLGKMLKDKVTRYPKLVSWINLDDPGDLKYLYTSSVSKEISVSIVWVNAKQGSVNVPRWLDDILRVSVSKDVVIKSSEISYAKDDGLTDEDLNQIRKEAILSVGKDVDMLLIFTGSYEKIPTSVGLVNHRDTIFIFVDALNKLASKGYTRDVLEKTTIMHEWGHLLGLEHVNDPNCIMNEMVEVYDQMPPSKSLPITYCYQELQMINKINPKL